MLMGENGKPIKKTMSAQEFLQQVQNIQQER